MSEWREAEELDRLLAAEQERDALRAEVARLREVVTGYERLAEAWQRIASADRALGKTAAALARLDTGRGDGDGG